MKVQLFITCLGENLLPGTLQNMVGILERVGVTCECPEGQTCCGQPFFNSGFQKEGRKIALGWMKAFDGTKGYIVAPSGSCLEFVKHRYPAMFPEGSAEHGRAVEIAGRALEFSQFLVNVMGVTDLGAFFPHRVTCHSPCHLTRGLGVRDEQQKLLRAVRGLELLPLNETDSCCGFGGIFSVVYPEVSKAMMDAKIRNISESNAEYVVVSEPGCLINIRGGLQRLNANIQAVHLIDILAMGGAG